MRDHDRRCGQAQARVIGIDITYLAIALIKSRLAGRDTTIAYLNRGSRQGWG
jgi:hypothetical protein